MTRAGDRLPELVEIMQQLRDPGGCPWDREQTHDSLRPYLVEETYEVLEALDDGDDAELRDELGDLLLQVVFHAQLARERNAFDIDAVVGAIVEKLVRRHPHVFADEVAASSADVKRNWARIKAEERAAKGVRTAPVSALDGIPAAMPALLRAHRLGEKASGVGFDWDSPESAWGKVEEELREVQAAASGDSADALGDEIGDLIFALASYARLSGLNAENVLERTLTRFRNRFQAMEAELRSAGRDIHRTDAGDLDAVWEAVKRRERGA